MTGIMQTILAAAIIVASLIYLARCGWQVIQGIRNKRNTACASCGVSSSSPCCPPEKKTANTHQ